MASTRTRSKTPKAPKAAPAASAAAPRADAAAEPPHAHGGDLAALLQGAAEEAARLLGADGAFLYLIEPETGLMRFTHSAGISELAADHRMRTLRLPIGVGMFGKAVADRRVVVTGDYAADTRFVHAEATDSFVDEIEIRSMVVAPLTAGDEVFGALGTFSHTADAFTAPQIALVRALSDHAAFAMANSRLIEELDRSRGAIERKATIERSLRELGTRISGARDPEAVVQHTIDEALRLLDGDGARIDIVDPEVRLLRGLYSAGEEQILETDWPRDPNDSLEVGASGRAVLTGKTYISRDYLSDENLVHGTGPDTYVRSKGIHGVIATPLFGDQGPFGAITVWSTKEDAFGPEDASLLETIAGQSAVALGRARLIEELGRSRETLAQRAEEERALREIASRLGAMGDDPADILNRIVNEAARLLGGERARLDLIEPLTGSLLWTFPPETPFNDRIVAVEVVGDGPDAPPTGLVGLALREGRPVVSGDYMRDTRFRHYPEGDEGVTSVGLHSIIAAPVIGEEGLLGVLQAAHRAVDAFGEDATRLIAALATQAAIAITNARLVDRLASSQAALGRTADAERALREIARRMMTIQDPAELLQDVVDEAARLLGSSGAVIDLLDPATGEIHWAYDAGIDDVVRTGSQERKAADDGVFLAIRERRVIVTDDYAADPRFADGAAIASFFEEHGIRSMAFAPLIGEAVVLGTLAVHAPEVGRFGEEEASTLAALADLATIAIHNAELIRELGRSREETARRAETERTLREIAARVTAIRDPETILGLIVDETRRVLGSDGAHLTRMSEDRTFVRPVVIAGGMDDGKRDWLRVQEFPIDGGINGLAAGQGRIVWTPNYATDPRIPRDEGDLEVAERMGLGAMAAAPLHAPGGEVIGTLAISYRRPGPISQDRLTMLQALADHAAIALSNSDLLARLEASEASFRGLVQASPDVIWRNDAEGRFTFMGEGAEQLFGWKAEEIVGRHFAEIVAPDSHAEAAEAWERLASTPDAAVAAPVRPQPQGRDHVSVRGVGGRHVRGRRVPRRPGHPPRHQRDGAPRARPAGERGALPRPRPELAGPHLRDGRERHLHVLLGPDRGGHRLGAGRDDRAPVHGLHRHVRVPPGGAAARGDLGQPRQAVHGPAAHPAQDERPPDPVRGQRRRPGRRDRAGSRRSAASPATSASASASRPSSARPRSATGSSSRTPRTSCSRPTPRRASCTCPRRSSSSRASPRPRSSARRSTRSSRPRRWASRSSAGAWWRRTRPCRRSCASSCATRTAARCRSRSTRSASSTARASSPASTGPRATSASGSASSASCATPRSATAR